MTENSGFETYKLYHALKLHFTSNSYDYFKYHGKSKVTMSTFETNGNKYKFSKLSRKYSIDEMKDFLIANMIEGKGEWIGDLISDGEECYKKWQKRMQSLTYTFTNDTLWLLEAYRDDKEMPFNLLLSSSICFCWSLIASINKPTIFP